MIRLSNHNLTALYLAPSAIAVVTEAGASQRWHGIRANVRTFDGQSYEVHETPEQIAALVDDTHD